MAKNVQAARREHEFDELIKDASYRHNVPVALIKAIIRVESAFDPNAVNLSDPSAGLMQTTPATASAVLGHKVDIAGLKNPVVSIEAGTRFLAYLVKRYPLDDAIQMYNLGETKFKRGVRASVYLSKVKQAMAYYTE